jgi:hypothetical protein
VRYVDATGSHRRLCTSAKPNTAGWEVSDAKRLMGLQDENRRLKKLGAEAMLDNAALKDLLGKNGRSLRHDGRRLPG